MTETILGRIRNKRGYTLVEALVTLLIVGIVTAGVAGGVAFSQRQFELSMTLSESKVLYSTLENAIRNEIAYADLIATDDGTVRFTSVNYADEAGEDPMWELAAVDADGKTISATGRGEIALVRDGSKGKIVSKLLPSTAYTRKMTASVSAEPTTVADDVSAIEVSITIYNMRNAEVLSESFAVVPENATIAPAEEP